MQSPSWTPSAGVVLTQVLPLRDMNRNLMLSGQQDLLAPWLFFMAFESRIPVNWCIKSYASCGRSFLSFLRVRRWQKKSHLLFAEAIVDFVYKVMSWGKSKQLAGAGIQPLFIFLRLLGKHKGVLRVGRVFTEQCRGRPSAHPRTHKRRWLSICSGAPEWASQEFWVLALMCGDGSQCACQGVWMLVSKHRDGYFGWRAQKNSRKIKNDSFQCLICEQTKESIYILISLNISHSRNGAEIE